jgi:hypothetical protein
VVSSGLGQGPVMPLVNTVMNFRVSCSVGKFLSRCTTAGVSRRAPLHVVSLLVSYTQQHVYAAINLCKVITPLRLGCLFNDAVGVQSRYT